MRLVAVRHLAFVAAQSIVHTVSLGHGTDPVTKSRNKYAAVPHNEQWHQYVVRWVDEAFPGVEHDFRNGAKAATDSSFFEWCWESLMCVDSPPCKLSCIDGGTDNHVPLAVAKTSISFSSRWP